MTQEEKAKAYDEAKERMKDFLKEWEDCGAVGEAMEKARNVFPELRESEDEGIRKELMQNLKERFGTRGSMGGNLDMPRVLAWLEKQHSPEVTDAEMKEILRTEYEKGRADAIAEMQNAWSEEDERLCLCLIKNQEKALEEVKNDKYGHSEIISDLKEMYRKRIDWLKFLKDRVGCEVNCTTTKEWDEEDDQYLLVCKNALAKYQASDKWDARIISRWLENKLKAHQTSWKPTEEQLEALNEVVNYAASQPFMHWNDYLYNMLKSLREQLKKLREE